MIKSLIDKNAQETDVGAFSSTLTEESQALFASVVSVTLSAFDSSEPLEERKNKAEGIQYSYIGLKKPKIEHAD
ncbi:hypothetical protein CN605_20125 [Bacillus toyonensis]|uniref:hypothetical protein n=1 Tax=Bacillus toyonensis TaxID=155322 RepID=UPI000BF22A8B|nr:hypothetical protein [Bacillus toyonensis]PEL42692.1 hypothetical protein CN605_20125 [Bacillus toyonensis]